MFKKLRKKSFNNQQSINFIIHLIIRMNKLLNLNDFELNNHLNIILSRCIKYEKYKIVTKIHLFKNTQLEVLFVEFFPRIT